MRPSHSDWTTEVVCCGLDHSSVAAFCIHLPAPEACCMKKECQPSEPSSTRQMCYYFHSRNSIHTTLVAYRLKISHVLQKSRATLSTSDSDRLFYGLWCLENHEKLSHVQILTLSIQLPSISAHVI